MIGRHTFLIIMIIFLIEVNKETLRMITEFQETGRFETTPENTAIVNTKYQ